jgi:hypothetical protein
MTNQTNRPTDAQTLTNLRKATDPWAALGVGPDAPARQPSEPQPSPDLRPPRRTDAGVSTEPPTARLPQPEVKPKRPAARRPPRAPVGADAPRLQIRTTPRMIGLVLAEISRRVQEGKAGRGRADRTVVLEDALERCYGHLIPRSADDDGGSTP